MDRQYDSTDDDSDRAVLAALLRSRTAGLRRVVSVGTMWTDVDGPDLATPAQGWKIHVSARPSTLRVTVDRALPVLLAHPCRFKVIGSAHLLRELNSAHNQTAAVGKAITAYPSEDHLTALAYALAEALAGLTGPCVLSDRRVRPDAPVYYRYGPFRARYQTTGDGDLRLAVIGPDGAEHPGAATPHYRMPDWLTDPFHTGGHPAGPAPRPNAPGNGTGTSGLVLGGRFRADAGVIEGTKGAVYRAVDLRTGRRVIVKQARAHVHEPSDGEDARVRLRNERHVLDLLDGLDTVPRPIDHFRHGQNEFLVTTDVGAHDLRQDVADNGRYRADTGARGLWELAANLLATLEAIHDRGVVVRDISPKNVVLDDAGRPRLVDFEISRSEPGPQFFGWTPGYSSPQQERHQTATREDDYYSVGATLFHAATGMDPVWLAGTDQNHDTARIAASLAANLGATPEATGLVAAVRALLDPAPAARAAAAAAIRARQPVRPPATRAVSDSRSPDLDALIAHLRRQSCQHARDLLVGRPLHGGEIRSPTNVYHGSAGVGLELLQHRADPAAGALAGHLAYWTAGFDALRDTPPGLLMGGSGTAVFVAAAGAALADEHLLAMARATPRPAVHRVPRDDYSHGAAGVGAGQLLLARLVGDPARHEVAAGCVDRFRDARFLRALRDAPPDHTDCASLSQTLGFAHGLAGIVDFLIGYRAATGDTSVDGLIGDSVTDLAGHVPPLLHAAGRPAARPMHASFCQGVAGIGTALLHAAAHLGSVGYLGLAQDMAGHAMALAPRIPGVSQCCGLAGVGEFVLDVALATGSAGHRRDAVRIAEFILLRGVGPAHAPTFPDHTVRHSGHGWATGSSGVLSFLRRLADPATPRLWPVACGTGAGRRPGLTRPDTMLGGDPSGAPPDLSRVDRGERGLESVRGNLG